MEPEDLQRPLAHLGEIVKRMTALVPKIQDRHGRHHPVLDLERTACLPEYNPPETRRLLEMILGRCQGHVNDVQELWDGPDLDPAVKPRCPTREWGIGPWPGPVSVPSRVSTKSWPIAGTLPIPGRCHGCWLRSWDSWWTICVLGIPWGLVPSSRFLRQLVAFGRRHLIHNLSPEPRGGPYRASMECMVDGAPTISCRLSGRPILNWRHVFRSLFPQKYQSLTAAEPAGPARVHYCSRLEYVA